ncbi:MAG: hypothetical protein JWM36_2917 [Hyphomicrobiales bacterium]|nr:hypothetical protein [Hyphomicrobiales bacterium]
MANEPENLVLELLRGMREEMRDMREGVRELRGDIREIRVVLDKHGMQLEYLDEHLEMLRESTMTTLGFATNTGLQQKKLAKQLGELAERVERLEKSK